MKRNIWLVCNRKPVLIETQRQINQSGALKTYCFFSEEALREGALRLTEQNGYESPSLILIEYNTDAEKDFSCMRFLQKNRALATVPVFYITDEESDEKESKCYELGATVVLQHPFSENSLLRIEKMAEKHEMTRDYEKMILQQSMEIKATREIRRLNEKLEVRNDFLYHIFGKYFPEEVVEVILDRPEGAALGGEKRPVTVLMADLRGFTSLSDRLSGEIVVDILDRFLGEMTQIITAYQGTVIEFIGDAVLAVFGAPIEAEHSEEQAIAAAISMQNAMQKVNEENLSKKYPEIRMGIGIHKGEVFIGNIGSEYMMRYNVIGQAVNLCSRIENFSLGGQILVSKQTLTDIASEVLTEDTFYISMKGIRVKIPICSVTGMQGRFNLQLIRPNPGEMRVPDAPDAQVYLYLMREKCTVELSARAEIVSYNDLAVVLHLLEESRQPLATHMDVEIVLRDANAYGKIVSCSEEQVEICFTYRSEHFLDS